MLDFKYVIDKSSGEKILETSLSGKLLLTTPQINKGTAFTVSEREQFGLTGKLPVSVETLEQQVNRVYMQYNSYNDKLNKNIYLNELLDSNEVLFYRMVSEHLSEILPIIYTPIVGKAVKQFSREFRHPRGIYLSYPEADNMEMILSNRSNPNIDLIVVTNGEGILGIGDQGIGGMDIPIAKLMVYVLCGGIAPTRTLPILLDVGTNNEELLNDPLYLGWRHKRLSGRAYNDFIAHFVSSVKKLFPQVFLHWEDFGRSNARKHLETYRNNICTFNDDMQGTGVVTLSAILAAVNAIDDTLANQRIVIFGAGTAGTGIADQIRDALVHEGMSVEEANKRFWLLDKPGLLCEDTEELTSFQKNYARDRKEIKDWTVTNNNHIGLEEVVAHVKPTILIGCSAMPNAFTKEIIQTMAKHCKRPIVLPLSNPTERCEAQPSDLYEWTNGDVLIATGSPFANIKYNDTDIRIAQCNNALVFPGIGLGLLSVKAKKLTDESLWCACKALSHFAPINQDPYKPLLPDIGDAKCVAKHIALSVAQQVIAEGNANIDNNSDINQLIEENIWTPHYITYRHRDSPK